MVVVTRTLEIQDGKMMAAVQHSLEVASYLRENFEWDIQVMRNIHGQVNLLHLVANFDSLASFEAAADQVFGDEGLQQLIANSTEQGLFRGGGTRDNLYRTVS